MAYGSTIGIRVVNFLHLQLHFFPTHKKKRINENPLNSIMQGAVKAALSASARMTLVCA